MSQLNMDRRFVGWVATLHTLYALDTFFYALCTLCCTFGRFCTLYTRDTLNTLTLNSNTYFTH